MCRMANLSDTYNKFYAKKTIFFRLEYLDCVNNWKKYFSLRTKLVYLRLNLSWKSKASNLMQPKFSASYKESVAAILQSVNVNFLT